MTFDELETIFQNLAADPEDYAAERAEMCEGDEDDIRAYLIQECEDRQADELETLCGNDEAKRAAAMEIVAMEVDSDEKVALWLAKYPEAV